MITLPRPPTLNTMYRNVPRVGRVKTKKYKSWISDALRDLKFHGYEPCTTKCAVTIRIGKHGKVKEDIDNRIKAVLDILVAAGVIEDDRLVWSVSATWMDWKDWNRCEVEITTWEGD